MLLSSVGGIKTLGGESLPVHSIDNIASCIHKASNNASPPEHSPSYLLQAIMSPLKDSIEKLAKMNEDEAPTKRLAILQVRGCPSMPALYFRLSAWAPFV